MKSQVTEIMMAIITAGTAVAAQDTQFNGGVADSRKSGGIISIFDSNL